MPTYCIKKKGSNLAKLLICSTFLPRTNENHVIVSRQTKDASFHGLPCNIGDYTGEVSILNLDTCMHLYNLDPHIFHVAEDNWINNPQHISLQMRTYVVVA